MKKRLFLVVTLAMVLMLVGCGSAGGGTDATESGEAAVEGPSELPEDGIMITISTDGMGQITSAEKGNPIAFSDEYPMQSSQVTVSPSTELVIAAKADDGWKFVKWTKNGEDYSTEEEITVTVTESAEYIACFEQG